MSNWYDEEMASLPAPTDLPGEQNQAGASEQRGMSDLYQQLNIDAPTEPPSNPHNEEETKAVPPTDQREEAPMEPPIQAVSTGARRRDPQPQPNWRAHSNTSQERGHLHSALRRHQLQRHDNRELIFIPSVSTGLIIGKRGSKIHELEYAANVVIKVGVSDGINTDVTIYGPDDAINKAKIMIKDLILSTAKTSGHRQEPTSANPINIIAEQFEINTQDDKPEVDCKILCEQYKKYREEQYAKLPPIKKDFYVEDPVVTAMPPKEVINWRKEHHDMKVRRNSHKVFLRPIPNPALTFEQIFKNFPNILHEIFKQGFTKPYPIQSQAWPILLRGDDLICIAPSGTGRTLAVLLSALIHVDGQVLSKSERKAPSVLIMASNQKMVLDIQKDLLTFQYHGIRSVCLYEEGDRTAQIKVLTKGVNIVISTPGRFNDLAMGRYIKVVSFSYVALIEVDGMIDMGYDGQIRRALYNMRPNKQLVMTCATWAIGVRLFALSFMNDPILMKLGCLEESVAHATVTQKVQFVEEEQKEQVLMQFLDNMKATDKVIIFCGKRVTASVIGAELRLRGIQYGTLDGDLNPADYEAAIADVVHGRANVLLATNVTSRNINIQNLTHVINIDYPGQIEEYVDRLDRTGRAGRTGTALTCITRGDWAHARDLMLILEETQQAIPDELEQMAHRFEAMTIIGRGNTPPQARRGRGWRAPGMSRPE